MRMCLDGVLLASNMAPKLYTHDISPPARAVLLTEKALGIELEHVIISLEAKDHFTPEYVKMNPQHTIPTLVDDDGTIICDSHAIMAYLVGKYGKDDLLYPKDLAKRALIDQRLHFDSGSVFTLIRAIFRSMCYQGLKSVSEENWGLANSAYEFTNTFLEGRAWIAGNGLTIADFSLVASITSLNCVVPIDEKYTNIKAWLAKAETLPYYHVNANGLAQLDKAFKKFMS